MKSKSQVKDEDIKDFFKKTQQHLIPSTFPVQLFLILRMVSNSHFKMSQYLVPHLHI